MGEEDKEIKKYVLMKIPCEEIKKVPDERDIYSVNYRSFVYLRFSKRHPKNKYYFGVTVSEFNKFYRKNLYILFICETMDKVVVIPGIVFSEQVEGTPIKSGQWKINIIENDAKFTMVISGKGKFDITDFVNYYDFTPIELRKGHIPSIKPVAPIKKEERIKEKIEAGDLKDRLFTTSENSKKPELFENAIMHSLKELGMSVEHIGGPGDTDLLVKSPFKMIVDAKATVHKKLNHVNFTRLKQHKLQHNAKYIVIVSVDFAPAVIKDAQLENATLIDVKTLASLLDLNASFPISPFIFEEKIKNGGLIKFEDFKKSSDEEYFKKMSIHLFDIINSLDFTPRTLDEIKGRIDYKYEKIKKEALPIENIRNTLTFLSSNILNIVKKENDKFNLLYTPKQSIERIGALMKYIYGAKNESSAK